MKTLRLANCFTPIFSAAKAGFADPGQRYESLAPTLIDLLESAANQARELKFAEAQVREAQFAVVAWVDEAAMSHPWEGAAQWRRAPLQRHFFSTTRAGVEFFQRLEALPEAATDAREVYALALLSGFQGRYATRPGGELAQVRRLLLERVMRDHAIEPLDAHSPLFEQPLGALPQKVRTVRRQLPAIALVLIVGIPALVLAGLYLTFDLSLAQEVRQLLEVR